MPEKKKTAPIAGAEREIKIQTGLRIPEHKYNEINTMATEISDAEWSRFVLRALINYHDRMTMCDERDPFNKGLRYALALVEKQIQK